MEACVNETDAKRSEEAKAPFVKLEQKNAKFRTENGNGSEITIREFLDFLKTAYQVQDNIEGILKNEGLTEIVDWLELKQNNLVKPKEIAVQTSDIKLRDEKGVYLTDSKKRFDSGEPDGADIKMKLSEVLSEGILDSVLPYLVPSNTSTGQRRLSTAKVQGTATSLGAGSDEKSQGKKSADTLSTSKPALVKTESEVEIHVHDEVKNVKKDFVCNQKLLVEQMGYFADVTAGQKLEDMDISVHCDIGIFEWLMRWVKKDAVAENERPALDVNCAIPVLVSAAFLQMEPLLEECLRYCHENMNEILKTNTSMSCLNDSVLSRLAAMYTNTEVEDIKDKKDKIQSKLFCKLIQALCEPEPESLRGHFSTMGRIYKCRYCQQLVNPLVEGYLPCVPCCTSLELDGAVTSKHVRDQNWSLTEYVSGLHSSLKTWRKVYWRIWGDAHFLYCSTCKRYFPSRQIGWCRFHPDLPQYFTIDAQRAPLPVGRYPCCGERAYRFQLLDDFSGCKFRDHEVSTKDPRDSLIASMLETYRDLVAEEPPELMFPERLTRLVARDNTTEDDGSLECKETMWWEGLEIIPQRPKLGMLGVLDDEEDKDSVTESQSDESEMYSDDDTSSLPSTTSSSSESAGSEEYTSRRRPLKKRRKQKGNKKNCRLWQNNLSARSNQDIQRAYEEIALKDISSALSRRTSSELYNYKPNKTFSRHVTPAGGIWMRLESEWKEANSVSTIPKPKCYSSKLKTKSRL